MQTPRRRGIWAPTNRPVRPSAGVSTGWTCDKVRDEGDATVSAVTADLISRARAGGRRRVPGADRAVPPRATGALLPDARILPGCRGRPPGHAARRLAEPWRVRGTRLAPHLAVPDRHQPVPQRASLGQPATRQGVGRARG